MPKSAEKFTQEDDALLTELGIEVESKKDVSLTAREERIIAGFEEIQRFRQENGRLPQHGEDRDIFERLYAARLDRIAKREECRAVLEDRDDDGLLSGEGAAIDGKTGELDDDALLAELGMGVESPEIAELRHVRPMAERKAAQDVANRERCRDFKTYKPMFEHIQKELEAGLRETRRFEMKAEIARGRFFIVGGQIAYVAEMGERFITDHGKTDARLRVIFDNGTESNMLMRSLQRALNKDTAGRRITEPMAGPLFAEQTVDGDEASGIVYVLRSKSDHPIVSANRELVHKIGVTDMAIEKRIAGAHLQPTFLMAGVEVVATYELFNISRKKLEILIHRIFAPARLDIEIKDRFGHPVVPKEWFLVPLFAIDDAVAKIRDGTVTSYVYDPKTAGLIPISPHDW